MFIINDNMKFLAIIFKYLLIVVVLVLISGRLFFPQKTEELVIEPARKLPIFGQVLGTAWDKAGQLGPTLTEKTVSLSQQIKNEDIGINEKIIEITKQEDVKESINKSIEAEVAKKVSEIENIPQDVLKSVEAQIRQQLYNQVCSNWQKELESSSSANQ